MRSIGQYCDAHGSPWLARYSLHFKVFTYGNSNNTSNKGNGQLFLLLRTVALVHNAVEHAKVDEHHASQ